MKLGEVKEGMLVAVNDTPTGMVYNVESVDGFIARLSYISETGKKLNGSREGIDISVLRKPTAAQLRNTKHLHEVRA
jgi:hypothetical protein